MPTSSIYIESQRSSWSAALQHRESEAGENLDKDKKNKNDLLKKTYKLKSIWSKS